MSTSLKQHNSQHLAFVATIWENLRLNQAVNEWMKNVDILLRGGQNKMCCVAAALQGCRGLVSVMSLSGKLLGGEGKC